ncbi:MAG: carboxymuconolactone decarboxylase family protein [Planctomycetes bacterium]|nr:carboxymuconolactone decarboxylase family protein [Planctomycetota bacterium]
MARIDLPEKGWVPSSIWEVYTGAENRLGYVPSTLKATSHSLRSLRAVDQLLQAHETQGTLEPELRLFASLAAAHRNHNEYGIDQVLRQARRFFLPEDKLQAILNDQVDEALFAPSELAAIRFAWAMTERADAGEPMLTELRRHLSEEKLVELAFIVAGRNFLDRIQCTFDLDTEPEVLAERN